MRAYQVDHTVIVADIPEEAREFFIREIAGRIPGVVEELHSSHEILCGDGIVRTVKTIINDEMERRNEWLRLGVPCELHWPFVVEKKEGEEK